MHLDGGALFPSRGQHQAKRQAACGKNGQHPGQVSVGQNRCLLCHLSVDDCHGVCSGIACGAALAEKCTTQSIDASQCCLGVGGDVFDQNCAVKSMRLVKRNARVAIPMLPPRVRTRLRSEAAVWMSSVGQSPTAARVRGKKTRTTPKPRIKLEVRKLPQPQSRVTGAKNRLEAARNTMPVQTMIRASTLRSGRRLWET